MSERELLLVVSEEEGGKRLDVFVAERLEELTRSQVKRLVEEALVLVNERPSKPSYRVRTGERIRVRIPPPKEVELKPEDVPFSVLYEDEHLAVVDKPAGVVVHPGAGHESGTLVHGLLKRLSNLSGVGGEVRPGIVHRLDKDTSGLMVVAKNDRAHLVLSRLFKERKVEKVYLAVVYGVPERRKDVIEARIARHPVNRKRMLAGVREGREAVTVYEVKEEFKRSALLEVRPLTGRTHQIRAHLSYIGHPILGDALYGGCAPYMPKAPRQMLHAWKLSFPHPVSGTPLSFEAEPPEDFTNLLRELRG